MEGTTIKMDNDKREFGIVAENESLDASSEIEEGDIRRDVREALARTLICVKKKNNGQIPSHVQDSLDSMAEKVFQECYG